MKKSKAASILEKIREEDEFTQDQDVDQDIDQDTDEPKSIEEMDTEELVDFVKEENWSQDPEKTQQALEAMKRIAESDDEDAKLLIEALDDAATEFDVEVMKEKKAARNK